MEKFARAALEKEVPLLAQLHKFAELCPESSVKELYSSVSRYQLDTFVLDLIPGDFTCNLGLLIVELSHGKWTTKSFANRQCGSHQAQLMIPIQLLFPAKVLEPHSNALLLDKKRGTATLYEPHGSAKQWWTESLTGFLEKWLQKQFADRKHPYRLVAQDESTCPKMGVQSLTGDALCHLWTLLHITLQIRYPHVTHLQTNLAALGKDYLQPLVRGWLCFIHQHNTGNTLQRELLDLTEQIATRQRHYKDFAQLTRSTTLLDTFRPAVSKLEQLNNAAAAIQHGLDLSRPPFNTESQKQLPAGFFHVPASQKRTLANELRAANVTRWWTDFHLFYSTEELTIMEADDQESTRDVRVPYITFDMTAAAASFLQTQLWKHRLELIPGGPTLVWISKKASDIDATFRLGYSTSYLSDLYMKLDFPQLESHAVREGWETDVADITEHYDGAKSYRKVVNQVIKDAKDNWTGDEADVADLVRDMLTKPKRATLRITTPLIQFSRKNRLRGFVHYLTYERRY